MVEHPDTVQCDQWVSKRGGIITMFGSNPSDKSEQAIHAYIDQLTKELQPSLNVSQAGYLNLLLKRMTYNDPAKRPTMAEALARFNSPDILPEMA